MISAIRRTLRRRARGEEGVGLILVIGVSVFVFLIAAAAIGLAINGLTQSRSRTAFEKSLATAEAGIDQTLGKLQTSFAVLGADYPVPATTTALDGAATPPCKGLEINFPVAPTDGAGGVFSSESAEKSWAKQQLLSIAKTYPPQCIHQGDGAQYVVLKPPALKLPDGVTENLKYGRVYALSATPSFANPQRYRLVKDEYVFMPYRPSFAILTGGDLRIASSLTVTTTPNADASLAAVHSNGSITGNGAGAITVTGPVTSSSTASGQLGVVGTSTPLQAVATVSARALYTQAAEINPGVTAHNSWFDLCPDGSVRDYSSAGPCTSPTILTPSATTSNKYNGWYWDLSHHQWHATKDLQSGVYYAEAADVTVDGGSIKMAANPLKLTVIAAAANPLTCASKTYGNIYWNGYDIAEPAFNGQWFVADTDLAIDSNFQAGSAGPPPVSGMFVAGDQVNLQTSSNVEVGGVIAASQCGWDVPSGIVSTLYSEAKNLVIKFDPDTPSAFTSVITTSLWLDYNGG
jgi:hypothetical protein